MAMSDDIAWFEQNRPMLSQKYPNLWVIVKNKAVVGSFPDYASAYTAGTQQFGTDPFLVKQATTSQKVETMTFNYLGRNMRLGFPRRIPFMGQGAPSPTELVERLRQDGALVNVQISVPAAYAKQLTDSGKAVPPPQVVKAMIDTGASISTVSDTVAAAAGLQQVGSVPIGGVGGMSTRPIYSASFGLPDYSISVDPIEIAGVSLPVGGFEVLVGRDVLRALEFDYTGPHGAFVLTQNVKAGDATPAAPGQPIQLATTMGLSPLAWLGIGLGGAALIGGGLWLSGVFDKKKK